MDFTVGDLVRYIPFDDCDDAAIENGIVKEIILDRNYARVVYDCTNPEKYKDLPSVLTPISNLKPGWKC